MRQLPVRLEERRHVDRLIELDEPKVWRCDKEDRRAPSGDRPPAAEEAKRLAATTTTAQGQQEAAAQASRRPEARE